MTFCRLFVSVFICEVVLYYRLRGGSCCEVGLCFRLQVGCCSLDCHLQGVLCCHLREWCSLYFLLLRGGSLLRPIKRWFFVVSFCEVVRPLERWFSRGGVFSQPVFSAHFSRHVFYWPIFCIVVEALTPCLHGGIASRPLLYCVMLSTWSCFVSTLAHLLVINLVVVGIALAHLLVINLVEEKRAFHSLQTIGNMSIYSMCKNSYTSIFKL